MYPLIILILVAAGIVFGIDYLLRRKAWKNNSKEEKTSLLINMFSAGPYVFLSVYGALLRIVPSTSETALGEVLHDITLIMGETYFVIAAVATILSFVFRKKGKVKASIWVNIIALVYLAVVLVMNTLASKIL